MLPRGHRGVVGEDVLGHDLLLLSEQARANDFRQSLLDAMRGAAVSSGITGPAMIWSRPMEIVARETAPILDVCHHCLRTATSRDYVTKGAGRPILNRLRWRRRVISPSIAHRGAGITAPRLTRATRSISDRGYEPRLWDWRCRALLARRTSTR